MAKSKDGDRANAVFDWFLMILICLNVIAVISGSVDELQARYNKLFTYFEYFSVGYGDVYPVTVLGKLLGGIISIMGIGLIAMPSGIISMGLIKEVKEEKKRKKREGRNNTENVEKRP
jgi:hypothetical protein